MKKIKIIISIFLVSSFAARAQLAEGKKNIEKLCGCFTVDFKYAETFSPDTAYKFYDRKHLSGIELVLPVEANDKKIVLQHLLVANDTMIIKHWREDWAFEQPILFEYEGDNVWAKKIIPIQDAKNMWTQTVWEVDDAPRYQGAGRWINTDEKTFWLNTTNAPLPRREYTIRKDYNILKRGNRIIVSDTAWWHEQDNQKILRTGNNDKLLAEEKGINYYYKIAGNKCEKAKAWWLANASFWNRVRLGWDEFCKTHSTISLKSKVENKRLDEYFTDLAKQMGNKTISAGEVSAKIKILIQKFAVNTDTGATNVNR